MIVDCIKGFLNISSDPATFIQVVDKMKNSLIHGFGSATTCEKIVNGRRFSAYLMVQIRRRRGRGRRIRRQLRRGTARSSVVRGSYTVLLKGGFRRINQLKEANVALFCPRPQFMR
ncbi:unnamed protein product [Camellia sinensis]